MVCLASSSLIRSRDFSEIRSFGSCYFLFFRRKSLYSARWCQKMCILNHDSFSLPISEKIFLSTWLVMFNWSAGQSGKGFYRFPSDSLDYFSGLVLLFYWICFTSRLSSLIPDLTHSLFNWMEFRIHSASWRKYVQTQKQNQAKRVNLMKSANQDLKAEISKE